MITPTARVYRLAIGLLVASSVSVAGRHAARAAEPTAPKLAGTWTWTWKDGQGNTHRHVLEVEGTGAKLAAREIFDEEDPVRVTNLKLDGQAIGFTVVRGDRRADYKGKVADSDHINGTVTTTVGGEASEFLWKAERRKDIPK